MEIDRHAAAVADAEIEIDAPPDVVWAALTDIDGWPRWNPDVKSASLAGPLAAGTTFRWKAGPGSITSTLRTVEPPGLVCWTGRTFGIDAVHVHRLEPGASGTIVKSMESWDGLVVRLLRGPLTKTLQKAIGEGLRHLKTEAERRAAGD
jgi:hypothetical protein